MRRIDPTKSQSAAMTRFFWVSVGLLAVALGVVGAVLPLLPTTPFLLLAAFCFARSSPRLQAWIEDHHIFGPMILNWRRYGSIDRRAKRLAVLFMAAAFALSIAMRLPIWALLGQGGILLAVSIFLLTRPDGPPRA
jgi:uncharacterized membrane protein YbaN (DUF454 family)